MKKSSLIAQRSGAQLGEIHEIVLQSYLFLGFPRMLTAAEHFIESFPDFLFQAKDSKPNFAKVEEWLSNGYSLCKRVYADNYDKLKDRISSFSPEIFDWMILEGYGKVLSRPGLDIKKRELAVVASLMQDGRPKQLFSHIRGSLNVGVKSEAIAATIDDVASIFNCEKDPALSFLKRLGGNV
ncbi:MAG TPA: carboxymuconolactone decarboxylase family protein [candidate division Zixibacteria bacterium]|nr:carboxymuconolactone decarboxylase family protein [candidate division Zixibacteria bacterium]